MIQTATFSNFKGLRQVAVDLERFTVFVGPNASGKTSILQGLYYLSRLGSIQVAELFEEGQGVPFLLLSRGAKPRMELSWSGDKAEVHVLATYEGQIPEDLSTDPSAHKPTGQWGFRVEGRKAGHPEQAWGATDTEWLRQAPAVLLRLDPARLSAPSYSPDTRPQLSPDGTGLPTVLNFMAVNQPEEFRQLQEDLRAVIPGVRRLRLARAPILVSDLGARDPSEPRKIIGDSLVVDFEGAPNIPGSMLSDGTLHVLGLLAVLLGPGRPKLVLLDDLDQGLHPKAQRDLIGLLRRILERKPDLQIVATSHSPYLLDHLRPEEIRLTTVLEDGSVACARLDDHPAFQKWKDAMTHGEFWSYVGENWIGERQAVESR